MYDKAFIYGLVDPRTEEVRYVGATNKPERRFKEHVGEAKLIKDLENIDPRRCDKQIWIAQLKAIGLMPIMRILRECLIEDAANAEIEEHAKYAINGNLFGHNPSISSNLKYRGKKNFWHHKLKKKPQ